MTQDFTIYIEPMGAPRMTRADAWRKREVVVRYHAYKDELRRVCKGIMPRPSDVSWTAYLTMPASWSKKKKALMRGTIHQSKPDRDNIDKGVGDSLFHEDQCIATGCIAKFWDDGRGARIEISVSSTSPRLLPDVLAQAGAGNPVST